MSTRRNMLPSPCEWAAVGASVLKFNVYQQAVGSSAATVSATVRDDRPVIRMAVTAASPTTNYLGLRTSGTNYANVPAGTTFWFSVDVWIPSSLVGTTLMAILRDDPNNDTNAVAFDWTTPQTLPLSGFPRDQWVRLSWKATVNPGRTVTGCYISIATATTHPVGTYWETTRWLVEAANDGPYFDGDTTDFVVGNTSTQYDWTGTARASASTETITVVNDDLELTWLDDQGAIRFEARNMTATDTVRMVGPGGRLVPLRGYEDATWHEGTNTGYGYHYEMPLGMAVTYCIADVDDDYFDPTMINATIETPDNEAWLRDLAVPQLSQKVLVVNTDDEIRQGRQTLITIAGRQNPLSLYDVRLSRSGTITLLVVNERDQAWGDTTKEHIDALLYSGRPLLFSMCMSKGFQPLYMSANDVTYTKVSSSTKAAWLAKINYQEVDNPTDVGLAFEAEVTWDMSRSMPIPSATYQNWKDSYPTFLDLVLDRPTSIPGRDLE